MGVVFFDGLVGVEFNYKVGFYCRVGLYSSIVLFVMTYTEKFFSLFTDFFEKISKIPYIFPICFTYSVPNFQNIFVIVTLSHFQFRAT